MIKIQSIINRLSKQIIDHLRLAGTWCNQIVPSRSFLEYQRNTKHCKEIENRQLEQCTASFKDMIILNLGHDAAKPVFGVSGVVETLLECSYATGLPLEM